MTRIKNTVSLEGFIGDEPKVLTSKNGNPFVTLTLATRNSYEKDGAWMQRNTVWHRNLYGFNSWIIEQAKPLKKGSLVHITAELEYKPTKDEFGHMVDVANLVITNIREIEYTKSSEQAE